MGVMGNRSPPQMFLCNLLLQCQELNAAKKWTTMSKISKRVSAITSKQMQFLFFYIIHQLFIHPGLQVTEKMCIYLLFWGEKKIQNYRRDQRPDEYGTQGFLLCDQPKCKKKRKKTNTTKAEYI